MAETVDPLLTYQSDFTTNLETQFTNITDLQNIQKKLFTDLEKLAGSPDIKLPSVIEQITDKFLQIDNLTKLRTNIFSTPSWRISEGHRYPANKCKDCRSWG